MDGSNENPTINLHKETIEHTNILSLLDKYKVDLDLDILSEDTDYADYWILEKILTKYRPKIVVHEINQQPANLCVSVVKPVNLTFWRDSNEYHGASVCAFRCLANRFNYTMIYCEKSGVNCFWMRDDLLRTLTGFDVNLAKAIFTPEFLWIRPGFKYKVTNDLWENIIC
jgi:hypothetical protein